VHHGQNDYCIDHNYGGILILWDRLFGSFAEERAGEVILYGIRKPLHSFNPLWGNLHYYADMWHAMRRARGWQARIGAWFAPPGGWHDGPAPHFEPSRFRRFSSGASAWTMASAALAYLLINGAAIGFLAGYDDMSLAGSVIAALSIILAAAAVGHRLDQPSRNTSL
jgi:hypothetical protein